MKKHNLVTKSWQTYRLYNIQSFCTWGHLNCSCRWGLSIMSRQKWNLNLKAETKLMHPSSFLTSVSISSWLDFSQVRIFCVCVSRSLVLCVMGSPLDFNVLSPAWRWVWNILSRQYIWNEDGYPQRNALDLDGLTKKVGYYG